jgi:hypothetical protein
MSDSSINVTPGSGGPNIDLELVDNGNARQVVCLGDPTTAANVAKVSAAGNALVDGSTVTQPISAVSLPLMAGAATSANQVTLIANQTNGTQISQTFASPLCISTVGTSGSILTATLPAAGAGIFHFITYIEITRFATVVNTASATPVTVTTTNLPGSLAITFDNGADALGVVSRDAFPFDSPLQSSVANTATTIVAPATTGILWRINVFYYTAI